MYIAEAEIAKLLMLLMNYECVYAHALPWTTARLPVS